VACNIISARVHETFDIDGNILIRVWKRTFTGNWSQIDEYTITGAHRYEETGMSIPLSAGDWVYAEVFSVTSMKLVSLCLICEAT
jgi:hypothetical protein